MRVGWCSPHTAGPPLAHPVQHSDQRAKAWPRDEGSRNVHRAPVVGGPKDRLTRSRLEPDRLLMAWRNSCALHGVTSTPSAYPRRTHRRPPRSPWPCRRGVAPTSTPVHDTARRTLGSASGYPRRIQSMPRWPKSAVPARKVRSWVRPVVWERAACAWLSSWRALFWHEPAHGRAAGCRWVTGGAARPGHQGAGPLAPGTFSTAPCLPSDRSAGRPTGPAWHTARGMMGME